MILLAEAQPTATFFWNFVLSIGLLLAFGANLATIIAVRRTQKREIHFGFEPASKAEFDRQMAVNEQTHRDLFSKVGGVERGARAHSDANTETLRKEIVEMGKSVAGLERETKNQNNWLERIDSKLTP